VRDLPRILGLKQLGDCLLWTPRDILHAPRVLAAAAQPPAPQHAVAAKMASLAVSQPTEATPAVALRTVPRSVANQQPAATTPIANQHPFEAATCAVEHVVTCACNKGFSGTGAACANINECGEGPRPPAAPVQGVCGCWLARVGAGLRGCMRMGAKDRLIGNPSMPGSLSIR
jgi:hypothetical protein